MLLFEREVLISTTGYTHTHLGGTDGLEIMNLLWINTKGGGSARIVNQAGVTLKHPTSSLDTTIKNSEQEITLQHCALSRCS